MTKTFDEVYRAFEDRFRGSTELIKERLRIYLPLLAQLPEGIGQRRVIDLGCGRGEWLEVVAEAGFAPFGVDLNLGMAQTALDKGFPVEIGDAVDYLRRQDAESAAVVSAFHIAEHLPIDKLIELLTECQRVLADGGLLIVETPNPENLSVATWAFYVDPTHEKPLPPVLLEFLVQQVGLGHTAILRMNGTVADHGAGTMTQAFQTLFETARDYACLAQKHVGQGERIDILAPLVAAATQADPSNMPALSQAIRKVEEDIALLHEKDSQRLKDMMSEFRDAVHHNGAAAAEELSALRAAIMVHAELIESLKADLRERDSAIAIHLMELEALRRSCREAEARYDASASNDRKELADLRSEVDSLKERCEALKSEVAARDVRLEAAAEAAAGSSQLAALRERELANVYASTSWRVTAPMRAVADVIKGVPYRGKAALRLFLEHALHWLRRRPAIASFVLRCLRMIPPLERRLLAFARARIGGQQRAERRWALDPDPQTLQEWDDLLKNSIERE